MTAMVPIRIFFSKYMPTEHSMRPRKKHRKQPTGKRKRSVAHVVEALARLGEPEDAIALQVNLNKNTLRRRHILDIARGRAAKAQATQLSRAEQHAINAILGAINSEWHTPDTGNDLWPGLRGGGARDAPDAVAAWLLNGARFVTAGLNTNFSPERLREFAEVKAAAEKLLQKAWPNKTGPTS
jgi:hypothetical protein